MCERGRTWGLKVMFSSLHSLPQGSRQCLLTDLCLEQGCGAGLRLPRAVEEEEGTASVCVRLSVTLRTQKSLVRRIWFCFLGVYLFVLSTIWDG